MTLSTPTVVEAGSSTQPQELADRRSARRWERAYLVLFVAYIGLGFTARSLGWIHGDGTWYVLAARRVLDGSFDVYGFRVDTSAVPVSGAAYNLSPLLAILIAPFVGLADWLGWGQAWAERLMALPLLVADVLAMWQLRLLVREWRPAADERLIFLGILLSLCLTSFWIVSAYGGHDEGLVLLFLLLALRVTPRNLLLGGAYAGLAVAAKQTAALYLLPVGFVLLAGGALAARSAGLDGAIAARRRAPLLDALAWGGVALAVFAAFVLPAALRNPGDAWYALVTQMSLLTTFGTGLPSLLDRALKANLAPSAYSNVLPSLLHYSNLVLVAVVAIASGFSVWGAWRRGRPIGLVDARLLALVAFGAVAQVVLSKWVSSHYYQLPLALVFLWDMVRTSRYAGPISFSPAAFPWIGLGSAIAFRSATQFVGWIKDGLIIALFVVLAGATLAGAADYEPAERAASR